MLTEKTGFTGTQYGNALGSTKQTKRVCKSHGYSHFDLATSQMKKKQTDIRSIEASLSKSRNAISNLKVLRDWREWKSSSRTNADNRLLGTVAS